MRKFVFALAVAACGNSGGSSNTPADASSQMADASHDAATSATRDAGPMGTVKVIVSLYNVPIATATVIFSDTSGHMISTQQTGVDGVAMATVPVGSTVTCELTQSVPGGVSHLLESIYDVQAGDVLGCGMPGTMASAGTGDGSVTVTFPGAFTGANNYSINLGGCQGGNTSATTATATLLSSCVSSTANTYDVLAIANGTGGAMLAYSTDLGLAPPGAGNTASVTVPSWRTDFLTHHIAISNAPANATVASNFSLFHDSAYWNIDSVTLTTNASGGANLAFPFPASLGTTANYQVTVSYPTSAGATANQGYDVNEPLSALVDESLDLSTLPQLLTRDAYVPVGQTTPMLSWAAAGSLAGTTGGAFQLQWSTTGASWTWYGAVPPTATSIQLPQLPDTLAGDRVQPGQAFDGAGVGFVQGTMFASPADFRANVDRVVSPPSNGTYAERLTIIH